MYERNHFNGAASSPRQIPLSAADLYINEEWRIQLLPLQVQNTHVVLLCEAWAMWHTDGLRDFGSRDDANWGSLGNKEGHESMKYEWDACFWVEHTAEWVGGWEKKEWEGGPQCMLLSSLQGLCSTELICCEMCKYCLDWCLVCRRDGEEEKEDGWGELWGSSLMKQDLKRWNHPQGGRGPHSKPPCYPCTTESIPLAHINKKICHGGGVFLCFFLATGTNQEPTKNELTSYLEDILGGIVLTLSKSNVYCNDCKWIGRRGGRSLQLSQFFLFGFSPFWNRVILHCHF